MTGTMKDEGTKNALEQNGYGTVCAHPAQVSCELDGEAVILNLEDGQYYGLDPVGARIWSLIQEPRTVDQIMEALLAEYEVEAEACRRDLLALLGELASHGLIEVRDELAG